MARRFFAMTWFWPVLAVLALSGCGTAVPRTAVPRGLPAPSREVLPNGLRLIIPYGFPVLGDPAEAELQRAKMFLLGQFALDRRTNVRLAWYSAFFESAGAGRDFADRYPRAVEAASAADVQRVAAIYLASPTVVTVGPGAQ